MHPLLNVITSFATGAAAMYWLDSVAARRQPGRPSVGGPRLGEQVQARIGQLVSHPDTIKVTVEGGTVRVSGLVLAGELDRLLMQLTQVPGVHRVHNALSAVQDARRFDELREQQLAPQPAGALL